MRNNEFMTGSQQETLTARLNILLAGFRDQHKLDPIGLLYFLVAYTWGYARACGWSSRHLADYSVRAYTACDKRERVDSPNGIIA